MRILRNSSDVLTRGIIIILADLLVQCDSSSVAAAVSSSLFSFHILYNGFFFFFIHVLGRVSTAAWEGNSSGIVDS